MTPAPSTLTPSYGPGWAVSVSAVTLLVPLSGFRVVASVGGEAKPNPNSKTLALILAAAPMEWLSLFPLHFGHNTMYKYYSIYYESSSQLTGINRSLAHG